MISFESQPYGEIFVMRADGSDVRQLTDDQWEKSVAGWPPASLDETDDGRRVAGQTRTRGDFGAICL
jgi:Tol biopolymer transport system component